MKNRNLPLVTVGTLVYNTGKYVIETLECLKRQNYPSIQHIIVDDYSQDDSVTIIEEWIERNDYACNFIKHEQNKGVQYGLKEIIKLAKGKYLNLISDDLWIDTKLLEHIEVFENLDDSYGMIYGDSDMIDKDGILLCPSLFKENKGGDFIPPSGDIFTEVVNGFYFYIQASTIRMDHFKQMNYSFDPEIISEDWDWQLWFSRNYNILCINKVFSHYRWLENSVSRLNWVPDKLNRVIYSQIKMVKKYYNDPKNSDQQKNQIISVLMKMFMSLEINKKNRLKLLVEYYILSKKFKFIIFAFAVACSFKVESIRYRLNLT